MSKEWPLWEVFVRAKNGRAHKHAGSVHAADARMAIEAARDTYTRRMEGVSLWVVPSAAITASDPGEAEALFAPAEDKVYRHPTFYTDPGKREEHLMPGQDDMLFHHAVRLGDDALVLAQRLSEWCGNSPMLELDLALANIALDLLGQSTLFLGLAGEIEGKGRDADALAYGRDVLDFRNCLLVEQPNGDFAQTIARQFLFSNWQELLMKEIAAAPEPRLSAIGAKAVKEIVYHARFANEWVVRLGDGTEESRARMIAGLEWMWRFTDELFDPKDGAPSHRPAWDARIAYVLNEAGLEQPKPRSGILGGRAGHHSEHLGHLLCEMQFLQRAYPGAVW